jgi:serine/threonine protein kinase/Tol biopolymer transport system component
MEPRTLGRYQALVPLAQGGMGAVFRAHDPQLQRDVAIKLLPPETIADETARARMLREARAASALSHPHICTIFEAGEADGRIFIAMELVDGKSLAQSIPAGGMPIETVLRLGAQIADAFAHAHERGVVHRDLKSANVMITREGRAKVLDFGLARRVAEGDGAPRADTTLTETGAVVGTPHYLPPEVLRGERGDALGDIWALGVLLHEMISGALPFAGRTGFELSAAILNAPPAPLPDRVPPGLRSIVQRCLAKDPSQRFRGAGEVRAALEALQSDATGVAAAGRSRSRRGLLIAVTAIAAFSAAVAATWIITHRPEPAREISQRQLTTNPADNPVYGGLISPDGRYLAYVDSGGVHIRTIETGELRDVALPAGFNIGGQISAGSWFPDGNHLLASLSDAKGSPAMWSLPLMGGVPRNLGVGGLGLVSPDGARIAFVRNGAAGSEIWCMDADGQGARRIVASDSSGILLGVIAWSPRAPRLLYSRVMLDSIGSRRIRLESCDLEGRRRIVFVESAEFALHPVLSGTWLPDGRFVFPIGEPPPARSDMNLWTLRVDPRTGIASGRPHRLTSWPHISIPILTGASVDGMRMAVNLVEYESDVYIGSLGRGDRSLSDVRRLTLDERTDVSPSWMPDGRTVLFTSDRRGEMDVFKQAIDATAAEPLVTSPKTRTTARASPDGAWILYREFEAAADTGSARLMRIPAAGGVPAQVLTSRALAGFACARWPATACVLCENEGTRSRYSAFDPLAGRGRVLARIESGTAPNWALSPDGKSVAIVDQLDSIPRLRVASLEGGPVREVRLSLSFAPGYVTWSARGDGWFVTGPSDHGFMLVRVGAHGECTPLQPPAFWLYGCEASPDGRHLAFTRNLVSTNIWLLEGF